MKVYRRNSSMVALSGAAGLLAVWPLIDAIIGGVCLGVLYTIFIVLAIVALVLFILNRR